jgi:hypothetical protein
MSVLRVRTSHPNSESVLSQAAAVLYADERCRWNINWWLLHESWFQSPLYEKEVVISLVPVHLNYPKILLLMLILLSRLFSGGHKLLSSLHTRILGFGSKTIYACGFRGHDTAQESFPIPPTSEPIISPFALAITGLHWTSGYCGARCLKCYNWRQVSRPIHAPIFFCYSIWALQLARLP